MDYPEFSDTHVTVGHFRACGYCAKGVRIGFDRYNLDYTNFLKHGINGSFILSITNNDAMVRQVVELAHEQR